MGTLMAESTNPPYMYRLEWIDAPTGGQMYGRWYPADKLEELEASRTRAIDITNLPVEIGRSIHDEMVMLSSVAEFGLNVERTNAQVELDSLTD